MWHPFPSMYPSTVAISFLPTPLRWLSGAVLTGGVVAPVLLMLGISQMPATGASLLLNSEAVFTVLLAWLMFDGQAPHALTERAGYAIVYLGLVGSVVEVMIDSFDPEEAGDGMTAVGRVAGQAPQVDGVTYIEGEILRGTAVGDIVEVTVNAAVGYDLVGVCDAS